jgi:hypothetical protein
VAEATWKKYERQITEFVERKAKGPVRITPDVKLDGRMSGVKRQVDILVEGSIFGFAPGKMAIDCKCLKEKVDVKDVEAFLGMLEDLGVTAGMLATTVGFTDAAKRRAANVVQEVIPLVDMVLLEEGSDWWLASAGSSGTYVGDYVDHEPYGDFWWIVSFVPDSDPGEEEDITLWSSNEGGWDAQTLGPNLLAGLLAQHHLARNPSPSEKMAILRGIEETVKDGQGFEISTGKVDDWLAEYDEDDEGA